MAKRCRIVKIVCLQPSREVVLSVFRFRDRLRVVCRIVINGLRDSKYDLHRLVYFRYTSVSVTIIDPNPICIFILFLGVCRANIFLFYTTFPKSGIRAVLWVDPGFDLDDMWMWGFDVLAMLPSSVDAVQLVDGMMSLLQGSGNRSALSVDDLLTVLWASS